jgi:hypothetical protein
LSRTTPLHGGDHFIQFPLIVAAGSQLALQLIQFLPGSLQAILIGAEWESLGLNVLQILRDSLEETLPPFVAAEPFIAVPVIGVIIAIGAIAVIPVATIAIIAPVSARLATWIRWNRLARG